MPLTATELQAIATSEAAKFLFVSLHTGDPSTTGANEATGGSYARQASGATATGGVITTAQVSWSPAAGTYSYWGIWSAATGGTFYAGGPLQVGGVNTPQTVSAGSQVKNTVTVPITSA